MSALTLEQKAALVVGSGYWATVAVPGIPVVTMNDGPHGLRTQPSGGDNLGLGGSLPATCFPPATGLASSWDRGLIERVGRAIGEEAIEQGVNIVLGPGVNIKRSALCGRNFEYFSEDPFVSGQLGAAWVRGVQSQGVGSSLKHFAANNQETSRMTVSAEVDERTLREIYLPAFEHIVTREKPWTVMCAYNRVNGVPAAENHWLLTEVLRDEWGFDGIVVSDWGAVDGRVPALAAGLDLEMPGPQKDSTNAVIEAVLSGELDEAVLDRAVERIRLLAERASTASVDLARRDLTDGEVSTSSTRKVSSTRNDSASRNALAREAAADSIVLLRNEGDLLPLDTNQSIAVIGEFARTPRFQGSGSSQVNPTRVSSALPALEALAPIEFAPGYTLDGRGDSAALIAEAVRVAARADAVLLFAGLPPAEESEGFDRIHLDLPSAQLRLIAEVAAANPRTVVILSNGGVVTLEPWHDSVSAILETWLLGQEGGAAVADVVFGRVAPSGRLAESIPLRLQDTPSYLNFPGENDVVRYGEGVFVGYRYYETVDVPVRYPFGFGLSYTTFSMSDLRVTGNRVVVTVTNTGTRAGRHVAQLYVSPPASAVSRPIRELRGFEKVALEPGESVDVAFQLDDRAFAYWDVRTHDWVVAGGEYLIEVGNSAHDIVLSDRVKRRSPAPGKLTLESSVAELLAHPVTGPILARAVRSADSQSEMQGSVFDMVASVPIRRLMRFPGVGDQMKQLPLLIGLANNPVIRTVAGWFRRG